MIILILKEHVSNLIGQRSLAILAGIRARRIVVSPLAVHVTMVRAISVPDLVHKVFVFECLVQL